MMHIEEERGATTKPKIRLRKRSERTETSCSSSNSSSNYPQSVASSECGNNPLNRLCLKLLDWNIFNKETKSLPNLPLAFPNYRSYVNTWEPLLIEEIRANILSSNPVASLQSSTNSLTCSIQIPSDLDLGRMSLVTLEGTTATSLAGGNHSTCSNAPLFLAHMDIVLLTERTQHCIKKSAGAGPLLVHRPQHPNALPNGFLNISKLLSAQTTQPASRLTPPATESLDSVASRSFLAIVTAQSKSNDFTFTALRQSVIQSRKNINVKSSLEISQYTCTVLASLTSSWREFLALHDAHRIPLLPYILQTSAAQTSVAKGEEKSLLVEDRVETKSTVAETKQDEQDAWQLEGVGEAFNAYLHASYNSSQLLAMRTAAQTREGFCLIQGPPGTGKTSTILGLLNTLHVRDYNRYFEALVTASLGEEGLKCRHASLSAHPQLHQPHGSVSGLTSWSNLVNGLSSRGIKPHLLVVAPSNVAVTNIIDRIVEKGFRDSSGSTYFPCILRVGSSRASSSSAKSVKQDVRSIFLEESVDTLLREEVDENILLLRKYLQDKVKEITHVHSILISLKQLFHQHKLNRDWELRIMSENGQPYWVDHANKRTSPYPPPYRPDLEPCSYTLETLPEYKSYAHAFVQLLEQLRVYALRNARLSAIIQHRAEFGSKKIAILKQTLEASFIEEADIVFSTLNSAGNPCLEGSCFPVVICDEAAQCVEMSTLIPLRHGAVQCVMVGDHKQLSATVFSSEVTAKGFDISLFERLHAAANVNAVMLDTQYRMLPEISRFPSKAFYRNGLKDGENVKMPFYSPSYLLSVAATPQHLHGVYFKPFIFFDLKSSQDCLVSSSNSLCNREEAVVCVNIVRNLISETRRMHCPVGSIGIITPYQEQLRELKAIFKQHNVASTRTVAKDVNLMLEDGEMESDSPPPSVIDLSQYDIEMNTVDAFQGREKDIILISCVRANDESNIGFLSDKRRMNVALTRGRFGMYVIGHADTLCSNRIWNSLILHAEEQKAFVTLSSSKDDICRCIREQTLSSSPTSLASRGRHLNSENKGKKRPRMDIGEACEEGVNEG